MSGIDVTKHESMAADQCSRNRAGVELLAPLLCLFGLCISPSLAVMHYGLLMGDLSLGKACGGAEWIDCNSVIASRYGSVLHIPVSLVGMWFYLGAGVLSLAIVLLRRAERAGFARGLCWISAAAVVADVYLGWAMWIKLERLCTLCLATYVINIALLLVALRVRHRLRDQVGPLRSILPSSAVLIRPNDPLYYREVLKLFLASLALGCILVVSVVAMIASSAIRKSEESRLASLLNYLGEIEPFEIPIEGRPTVGPANAEITIAIFSDFLCEQCRLADQYLDIVSANHRDSLRIVYFHYPLDATCNKFVKENQHPGACELARGAECADRQGRFWGFHDVVFDEAGKARPERMAAYATLSGLDLNEFNACLAEPGKDDPTKTDIDLAHSVGVMATPTLFINGRPIIGALEPWMLEAAIERIKSLPQ